MAGSGLPMAGSDLPQAGSGLPDIGSELPETGSGLQEAGCGKGGGGRTYICKYGHKGIQIPHFLQDFIFTSGRSLTSHPKARDSHWYPCSALVNLKADM